MGRTRKLMAAGDGGRPHRPMLQEMGGLERGGRMLTPPTGLLRHQSRNSATANTRSSILGGPPGLPFQAKPGGDIRSCGRADSSSLGRTSRRAFSLQDSPTDWQAPHQKFPTKERPPQRSIMTPPTSVGTHSVPRSPPLPRSKTVQEAAPKLHVGFLPPNTTRKDLLKRFAIFGEIANCSVMQPKPGSNHTYGFIQFVHKHSSQAAIRVLNNARWGDFCIHIEPTFSPTKAKPPSITSGSRIELGSGLPCTVYVKRLPLTATVETLRALFGQVGKVKNVWMAEVQPKAESLYGFVQFHTLEEAGRAVDRLNGTKVGVHQRIVVQLSHRATPLYSYTAGSVSKVTRSETEGVKKTHLAGVVPSECTQGTMTHRQGLSRSSKVAKHTSSQANVIISHEVALSYLKMHIPCPPCALQPSQNRPQFGHGFIGHQQLKQGDPVTTPLSPVRHPLSPVRHPLSPVRHHLDSGIQSQVCTSNPTSACSTPVHMPGSTTKGKTESEPAGLHAPNHSKNVGVLASVEHSEEAESHGEIPTSCEVVESMQQSLQCQIAEGCRPVEISSDEDNFIDLCPPPLEGLCDEEPPALEVPRPQIAGTGDSPGFYRAVPNPHSSQSLWSGMQQSSANTRESSHSARAKSPVSRRFTIGRGQRLAKVLDMLSSADGSQSKSKAGLNSPVVLPTSSPLLQESSSSSPSHSTCEEAMHLSLSPDDGPPPLTTPPQPSHASSPPTYWEESTLTKEAVSKLEHPRDLGQAGSTSARYSHPHQAPHPENYEAPKHKEVASVSRALATTITPPENPSDPNEPQVLEGDSFLLPLPESVCQVGSSGDEREVSKTRHGRSSDELERSIAQHERNTRRWQVETRRLKQRTLAIKEELGKEEAEVVEWNLFEDVSEERLREFDQILEAHAKFVTETERLSRRELNHELILMKVQQTYEHDTLALLEVTRELEAEEARDKLSLAKLENTALHRKAEYMV